MQATVTLADVAKAAGVSLATASRALNGSGGRKVREDLHARVEMAAERLGYSPNTHAQAIAKGMTSVVGLIVHDIADPYFSSIAAGVMREAARRDLVVTLATSYRDPHKEATYAKVLHSQRCQAMVLVGSRFNNSATEAELAQQLKRYEASGGRVALVSQPKLPFATVKVENRAASRALAYALHDHGHRDFAVIAGPTRVLTSTERLDGFRAAVKSRGSPMPRQHVFRGEFTRDGGYEAMTKLLDSGHRISCAFSVTDIMAVGAMACLRDRGLIPGEHIGVAGFDDIQTLRDISPSLTTVRIPLEQMGEDALALALDGDSSMVTNVPGKVLLRESTRPIPG